MVPSTAVEESEESSADMKLTTLVECVSAIKFVDTAEVQVTEIEIELKRNGTFETRFI